MEGPIVGGAKWQDIASEKEFSEYYEAALQGKTALVNEFGKLAGKAASVLTIELIQSTIMEDDTQTIVSKVCFVDMPGSEVLAQDAETLRIREGNTMNKGILGVRSVLEDIAGGKVFAALKCRKTMRYMSRLSSRACAGRSLVETLLESQSSLSNMMIQWGRLLHLSLRSCARK